VGVLAGRRASLFGLSLTCAHVILCMQVYVRAGPTPVGWACRYMTRAMQSVLCAGGCLVDVDVYTCALAANCVENKSAKRRQAYHADAQGAEGMQTK
jgi:hypothetical protein